ncbi:MAG TPA: segregation/condensation protein A, partial [Chloroflexota bacterium]|nr:segregation/condensation protein A [Chloroflexota bacterium]
RDRLKQTDRLEFSDLAAECHSRIEIVYTLLSVLHLVADREIAISQRKPFGPIQIGFVEDD